MIGGVSMMVTAYKTDALPFQDAIPPLPPGGPALPLQVSAAVGKPEHIYHSTQRRNLPAE
jgi:hypothetical protein